MRRETNDVAFDSQGRISVHARQRQVNKQQERRPITKNHTLFLTNQQPLG